MRAGVLITASLTAALIGCVQSQSVVCGDLVCASSAVCHVGLDGVSACVPANAVTACVGLDPLEPCNGGTGVCRDGLCIESTCGNTFLDPDEECDDGNLAAGDACGPTCRREACRNNVLDPAEQCDDGNALSHDGCSSGCTVEVPAWRNVGTPWQPRRRHALAYDSMRQRVVLFGGVAPDRRNDTWELVHDPSDLQQPDRWRPVFTTHAPSPRTDMAMAYDSQRHVIVLFGGFEAAGSTADTWEYDGADWHAVTTASTPAARGGAGMAYDELHHVIVLVGGRASSTSATLNDTWEYDGTTWTSRVTGPPLGPTTPALAYDGKRNVIVMTAFGVSTYPTWEYANGAWTTIATTTAQTPPARQAHSLVYDAARQRVVLAGGYCVNLGYAACDDLWEYDGAAWVQGPKPPDGDGDGLAEHAMAFDAAHQRTVLVGGGVPNKGPSAATQLFAADAWSTMQWSATPRARNWAVVTYDTTNEVPLLFGGVLDDGSYVTDLWELVHDTWLPRSKAIPGVLDGVWAGAYDSMRGRLIVYGSCKPFDVACNYSQTYELAAGLSTWSPLAGMQPPPRAAAAWVYDDVHGFFYVFGGLDRGHYPDHLGDTWRLDSSGWSRIATTGPEPRWGAAMAYDPIRDRVVLFGGGKAGDELGDTWELHDSQWAQWTPGPSATAPSKRFGAAMVYDPIRKRVVLHGGAQYDGATVEDLWEFDGTSWTRLNVAGAPPAAQSSNAVTYDRANRRIVMTRGQDTWTYRHESALPDEDCQTPAGDNDGDGLTGCADPDCAFAPGCH